MVLTSRRGFPAATDLRHARGHFGGTHPRTHSRCCLLRETLLRAPRRHSVTFSLKKKTQSAPRLRVVPIVIYIQIAFAVRGGPGGPTRQHSSYLSNQTRPKPRLLIPYNFYFRNPHPDRRRYIPISVFPRQDPKAAQGLPWPIADPSVSATQSSP